MNETICGLSRAWILMWLAVAETHPEKLAPGPCWHNRECDACSARLALIDPAKLAELMAEEVRRRGFPSDAADLGVAYDMTIARAFLHRLMQLTESASGYDMLKALEMSQ